MALEVEHKFLLNNANWRKLVKRSAVYRQGYLSSDSSCSIRVRISNDQAWLNIKSATIGTQRSEYEYQIPVQDADEMLDNLCRKPLIEKIRHFVDYAGHVWEIDEFQNDNAGLIVAEIELSEVGEEFLIPDWVGAEVTDDVRYYNHNLSLHPYNTWRKS